MVFVRRGQKAQDNKSFLKVTPLIWAIDGKEKLSHIGGMDLKIIINIVFPQAYL